MSKKKKNEVPTRLPGTALVTGDTMKMAMETVLPVALEKD